MLLSRRNIITENLSTTDVSEPKCDSCQFANTTLQYTGKQLQKFTSKYRGDLSASNVEISIQDIS